MVQAQCVNKYPYTYDFEKFDSLQSITSCDLTTKGDTSDGWLQDLTDDGDWRADSAGTPSTATGPGSTSTTSGVGSGTDYSPGTTAGTYLYTESSGGCVNSEINLLSPCFDFSGTSYYQLEFAYHMYGAAMGSLSIDIFDGTNWTKDVWRITGSQGTSWKLAKVGLAKFNGSSIQIRFRAVTGSSFTSDCALDAITISTYTPDNYDALIFEASLRKNKDGYYFVPGSHISDSLSYTTEIRNNGIKQITGVKVYGELKSQKDTVDVGSMTAYDRKVLTNEFLYWPKDGDEELSLNVGLNETDVNYSNNSLKLTTGINDSIYSRDNGEYVGGVGANTGTIEIGNVYQLYTDDTLTSVSFFINGGTSGDSVRVNLYEYSGTPGNVIERSPAIKTDGTARWYTTKLVCDQNLKTGTYFVSIEQLVTNSNMALGYDNQFYKPNVCKYSAAGWPQLNLAGGEIVLVRMNFGEIEFPTITVDLDDSICSNQQYVVEAKGADTYVWEPFGPVKAKTGNVVKVQASASFTLKVTGTDKCGKEGELQMPIFVKKVPNLSVNNDTTVCEKEPVTLIATTGSQYRWVNGPANTNYSVTPSATTAYTVIADSSNGCSSDKVVQVTISKPVPVVNNDTTLCEAQPLTLMAGGGTTYQWTGGSATATYMVNPRQTKTYVVKVVDGYSCVAFDSVTVTVTKGPNLSTSNDTAVCFGSRASLMAYGADSYEWEGGPQTADYNALPISSKTFYVKGFSANGCFIIDSVVVEVARIPSFSVRDDTTICEGITLILNVETTDDVTYNWSTGEKTKSITVSPKFTTSYNIAIENSTGCGGEDSIKISVDPLPTIDFKMTQAHKNITILNYSDHGDTYLWKFGDGDSSTDKSTTHRYRVHGSYTLSYAVTNKCGTRDTSYIVDVENVGVDPIGFDAFKLYPNPAKAGITIDLSNNDLGSVHIHVLDITGKEVFAYVGEKMSSRFEKTIDLGKLARGTYIITVATTHGRMTQQLMLE